MFFGKIEKLRNVQVINATSKDFHCKKDASRFITLRFFSWLQIIAKVLGTNEILMPLHAVFRRFFIVNFRLGKRNGHFDVIRPETTGRNFFRIVLCHISSLFHLFLLTFFSPFSQFSKIRVTASVSNWSLARTKNPEFFDYFSFFPIPDISHDKLNVSLFVSRIVSDSRHTGCENHPLRVLHSYR